MRQHAPSESVEGLFALTETSDEDSDSESSAEPVAGLARQEVNQNRASLAMGTDKKPQVFLPIENGRSLPGEMHAHMKNLVGVGQYLGQ